MTTKKKAERKIIIIFTYYLLIEVNLVYSIYNPFVCSVKN